MVIVSATWLSRSGWSQPTLRCGAALGDLVDESDLNIAPDGDWEVSAQTEPVSDKCDHSDNGAPDAARIAKGQPS